MAANLNQKLQLPSFEEMMQARVPVSFHYADGWGMDAYHICCHLQDRHHYDLSKLVDRAETINDVVYVIQSAAIREKVNPLEYLPVPISYKGQNFECSSFFLMYNFYLCSLSLIPCHEG